LGTLETRILGLDLRNEDLRILGLRGFLIFSHRGHRKKYKHADYADYADLIGMG